MQRLLSCLGSQKEFIGYLMRRRSLEQGEIQPEYLLVNLYVLEEKGYYLAFKQKSLLAVF